MFESELIAVVERASKTYRNILRRKIDGHRCHCYAGIASIGDREFWNVKYKIDGKEANSHYDLINTMFEIVEQKVKDLKAQGRKIYLWTY